MSEFDRVKKLKPTAEELLTWLKNTQASLVCNNHNGMYSVLNVYNRRYAYSPDPVKAMYNAYRGYRAVEHGGG